LTGALGGVGWYFWLRKEPKDAPASQSTGQTTQPVGEGKDNYDDTVVTKHFTSSAFGLDFDYPEQWKAAEGADNKIVVISPAMKFNVPGDEGTEYAQVIFTVQHKQSSLPEFKTGNALAVRESEKMAYKKPSQVQRANTYLSFLNYAASKSKGIDGVYITGDFGYTKDQYVPQDEVVKADPLITVAFRHCNDDYDCKTPGDLMTVSTDFWDTPEAAKDIKTLLESIVVQ
jgi:hypothetical protein